MLVRGGAILLLLMCSCAVSVHGQDTSGIDLATAKWFASVDVPVTATADEITSHAKPVSPLVMLKTDPGIPGTLFCILDLPGGGRAGEIVIGDIEGNDETYFNGTLIGSTSGWGVTDNGRSRVYRVDAKLIRAGQNVLAVRIVGPGGRGMFSIKREPITFSFIDGAPAEARKPDAGNRGVSAVAEAGARAAIAEVDPDTSRSEPLLRKRPGFGRFGRFYHDGLPTVSHVSPTHIENRNSPILDIALDPAESVEIADGRGESGIDPFHKLSRVKGRVNNQPVIYTALHHVMYPGVVFALEQGNVFQVRVRFASGQGAHQVLSDAETAAVFGTTTTLAMYAFYDNRPQGVPVLIAAPGFAANLTQADDHVDLTFSAPSGESQGRRIFVFYPTGIRSVTFDEKPKSMLEIASAAQPDLKPADTLREWLRIGLHEPTAVDEYFQVRPERETVRVYQVSEYRKGLGKIDTTSAPMFIPPQIPFAMQSFGFPAQAEITSTGLMLSYSGPVVECNTTQSQPVSGKQPGSNLQVCYYDLPLPPLEERGLIAVPAEEELKALINQNVSDLGSTTSATGVDRFYKSRTQAFQAFSYLTTDTRTRLIENCAQVIPGSFTELTWNESIEPFSGLKYWWTYYIEGPYFAQYDQDWGNGLSLIGLYTYIKYTGDWDLATQQWDAIEKMFAWFTVTDDWEWMRGSNAEHGHGTGAGDCSSVTYAAALSYAKLAKGVGRMDDYYYGLYMAARAALPTLNRFAYDPFADSRQLKEHNSMVVGFHEGAGFLVGELDGYAWSVTSNISGNGVQPENFSLYRKFAPQLLRDYEQRFETAYPQWMNGEYKYEKPTLYRNNSGYISLPHIYLRARLGPDSFQALREYVMRAKSNNYLWWLAPPVIAELLNMKTDGTYVSDWGRCGFLGGEIERDRKKMRITARFQNKYPPDTVEFALPSRPAMVEINNGPVPLTDTQYENGKLKVKLRRPGMNTVQLAY